MARKPKQSKSVETLTHEEARRRNIPTAEYSSVMSEDQKRPVRVEYVNQQDARVFSEHERDAVISAVAAREGFEGRWTHDLSECRFPTERNPSDFWLAPVRYFWPPKK